MATWDELAAIRPGAAVRVEDEDFEVERTICFDEDGGEWFEHRLSSAGTGRSLWVEVPHEPGQVVVYEHSAALDGEPRAGPEIEYEGERLAWLASGRAAYRSVERGSSAPKQGTLVYHDYAAGDRRVTYETRGDAVWEVSEGRLLDPGAIEVRH
jgi:hypothetical protein